MPTPRFIWHEPTGEGRNGFAIFRRAFDLAAVPASAVLRLFAADLPAELPQPTGYYGYGYSPYRAYGYGYSRPPVIVQRRTYVVPQYRYNNRPYYAPNARAGGYNNGGSYRNNGPGAGRSRGPR